MLRSEFKKLSFEDKFSRQYACWVRNNPKAWSWFKRQNRRIARNKLKNMVDKMEDM